jgi:hypothetical protein
MVGQRSSKKPLDRILLICYRSEPVKGREEDRRGDEDVAYDAEVPIVSRGIRRGEMPEL